MTDLITEARELCEKATLGPWFVYESHNWHKDPPKEYCVITRGMKDIVTSWVEKSDAQFIARSRTLIPELCDALEKAQEQNKQLVREVSELARESVERAKNLARLEAEVEAAIEARRWIPTTERLPEERGDYLCTYFGAVFIAEFRNGFWSVSSNEVGSALWGVTHWMPLPAPPEKEGE